MVLEIPLWAAGPEGNEFEHSALLDRRLIEALFQNGGVVTNDSFVVSQRAAGTNMSVDISPGKCVIPGTHIANQGSYYCRSTSVQNRTVAAAPGAGSRTDIVVARVHDSEVQGIVDEFEIEVLTGTTTVPNDAILLAEIVVPNGASAVTNAMITDERSMAALRTGLLGSTRLARATRDSGQNNITSVTDLTGLSITFVAPLGHNIRIEGRCNFNGVAVGNAAQLSITNPANDVFDADGVVDLPSGVGFTPKARVTHQFVGTGESVTFKLRASATSSGANTVSSSGRLAVIEAFDDGIAI